MKPIDILMLGPTREATRNENGWLVTITPAAVWGIAPASLQLTEDQYIRYLDWQLRDGLIQDCLPDLSGAEREVLITGIDPQSFGEIFSQEEDGDSNVER